MQTLTAATIFPCYAAADRAIAERLAALLLLLALSPFLLAIARTITNRSLELGRKYESSIRSAHAVAEMHF